MSHHPRQLRRYSRRATSHSRVRSQRKRAKLHVDDSSDDKVFQSPVVTFEPIVPVAALRLKLPYFNHGGIQLGDGRYLFASRETDPPGGPVKLVITDGNYNPISMDATADNIGPAAHDPRLFIRVDGTIAMWAPAITEDSTHGSGRCMTDTSVEVIGDKIVVHDTKKLPRLQPHEKNWILHGEHVLYHPDRGMILKYETGEVVFECRAMNIGLRGGTNLLLVAGTDAAIMITHSFVATPKRVYSAQLCICDASFPFMIRSIHPIADVSGLHRKTNQSRWCRNQIQSVIFPMGLWYRPDVNQYHCVAGINDSASFILSFDQKKIMALASHDSAITAIEYPI